MDDSYDDFTRAEVLKRLQDQLDELPQVVYKDLETYFWGEPSTHQNSEVEPDGRRED